MAARGRREGRRLPVAAPLRRARRAEICAAAMTTGAKCRLDGNLILAGGGKALTRNCPNSRARVLYAADSSAVWPMGETPAHRRLVQDSHGGANRILVEYSRRHVAFGTTWNFRPPRWRLAKIARRLERAAPWHPETAIETPLTLRGAAAHAGCGRAPGVSTVIQPSARTGVCAAILPLRPRVRNCPSGSHPDRRCCCGTPPTPVP